MRAGMMNRADGWEKDEWLAIIRSRCPTATEEELEQAWAEFMEMKAAMLDCNQAFVQ